MSALNQVLSESLRAQFVDSVSSELLTEAVMVLPCCHNLNRQTVDALLSQHKPCPLDNRVIESYQPNHAIRGALAILIQQGQITTDPVTPSASLDIWPGSDDEEGLFSSNESKNTADPFRSVQPSAPPLDGWIESTARHTQPLRHPLEISDDEEELFSGKGSKNTKGANQSVKPSAPPFNKEKEAPLLPSEAANDKGPVSLTAGAMYREENRTPSPPPPYEPNIQIPIPAIPIASAIFLHDGAEEALFQACQEGNLAKLQMAIDHRADVNAKKMFTPGSTRFPEPEMKTPLLIVSELGHLAMAQLLIARGANVKTACKIIDPFIGGNREAYLGGWTPLHAACRYNYPLLAHILIEAGADVNAKTTNSDTPLFMACAKGDPGLVEELIKNQANIRTLNKQNGNALSMAVQMNHLKIVEILVQYGAPINSLFGNPLNAAARKGHVDCLNFLIAQGAKVNFVDQKKQTALACACQANQLEAIRILLTSKASPCVNLNSELNFTTSKRIASLHGGRSVSELDMPAVIHCAITGNTEAAALLLKHGADVAAMGSYKVMGRYNECDKKNQLSLSSAIAWTPPEKREALKQILKSYGVTEGCLIM